MLATVLRFVFPTATFAVLKNKWFQIARSKNRIKLKMSATNIASFKGMFLNYK